MIYIDRITKKTDLENNDSMSVYDNKWGAQQNHNAFEIFFYFLKEIKPKRIVEIGTSTGGFISFLNQCCKELSIDCEIVTYDIIEYPYYKDIIESGVDVRIKNIFKENYEDIDDDVKNFIQSDGITLILCDGGNKKMEFNILSNFIKEGDFIMGHDYCKDNQIFEQTIKNKIWNWFELSESDIIDSCNRNNLIEYRSNLFNSIVWTCWVKNKEKIVTVENKPTQKSSNVTLVTGLWNIGRDKLETGWSRPYSHYLEKFESLLNIEENLIIFGDDELESFVNSKRKSKNTFFVKRDLDWFKSTEFFPLINSIRTNSDWYNQSEWLKSSTQAKLDMYNPLVMSKVFLLHDAKIIDPFNSEYMFWIDAGLTNTVHGGYFTHDKVLKKLPDYFDKFSFVCFPYIANNEIHGFTYPKINEWANSDVKLVGRGGFFGGPKDSITSINQIYYNILMDTLRAGYMGTEESIFSIMVYKHCDIINYFEIEDNGLMGVFFENLKNETLIKKNTNPLNIGRSTPKLNNIGLYVITFNSPKQFETLINSINLYDVNFIKNTKKFLLDNSSDLSTTSEYRKLCEKYDFEHIKKDNLGICGGRQWIAEHAEEQGFDGYWFSEDDMFFQSTPGEVCRNGFPRFTPNLYEKCLEIVKKENFDFLKINFSEFYGDNSTQWAWYNVPQNFREQNWPYKTKLPVMGLDPNAPKTKFNEIKTHQGVPYATGEIYYCNWTHFVTREGNKKMFLTTKWAHPFENTWMSYMYQETIKGNLNPGILLMTPIEHNRFEHYDNSLRKES